jgi:hypothetical protein
MITLTQIAVNDRRYRKRQRGLIASLYEYMNAIMAPSWERDNRVSPVERWDRYSLRHHVRVERRWLPWL